MKFIKYFLLLTVVLIANSFAQADLVHDWNTALLDIIKLHNTPAPAASRNLAILHAAIFDAINGVSREYEPYLVERSSRLAPVSAISSGSSAAHAVLSALYPDSESVAIFDALNERILSEVPRSLVKARGVIWGQYVAKYILKIREKDGADVTVPAPSTTGPGAWVPTPPDFLPFTLPQWAFVVPFTLKNPKQFRPDGPPRLFSSEWAQDFNEVKELGSKDSTSRTTDQTQSAFFWADGSDTRTPAGHWNAIAQTVTKGQQNSLIENARLFALLNLAMADAAIAVWDSKYHYFFWRPITAIEQANTDGNPLTEPDTSWEPLIVTPSIPEYVSGHSTFSAAAAAVLALFYGTDSIAFSSDSDTSPPISRHFSSFSSAALDAALSRLYGGIHFRTAIDDGLTLGASIGQWTYDHFLGPKLENVASTFNFKASI